MAKLTLATVTGDGAVTLNANFAAIVTAMENTLSRDGTTPNTMSASLDMNSNTIINLPTPTANAHAATKKYVDDEIVDAVEGIVGPGGLASITVIDEDDGTIMVGDGTKWVGESGATARTSLGLAIGTDVQAYDAGLAYLAGLAITNEATFKSETNLEIGVDVQAYSAVLAATTASFTTADETKLDGIEASADVTDTANVTAAGALMDSEVDADIKTLTLPANTTISTFGASLVDDADASAARTTLGLGTAATSAATDFVAVAGDTITGAINFENAINYTGTSVFYIRSRFDGGEVQIGTETSGGVLYYPIVIDGADDEIRFNNAAGEIARFNTTGYLGLGTTTPRSSLDVIADAGFATATAGTGQGFRIGTGSAATDPALFLGITDGATDYGWIQAIDPGTVNYTLALNPNGGNIGIGTVTPNTLLHLKSNAPYITFEDDDNNQDWQIQATAWFAIRDETSGDERLRIDSSGNVGIGTTAPDEKLVVARLGADVAYTSVGGTGAVFHKGGAATSFPCYIQVIGGTASGAGIILGDDVTPDRGRMLWDSNNSRLEWRINNTAGFVLNSSRDMYIGKTISNYANTGVELTSGGLGVFTRASNLPLIVNRETDDGTLVSFRQDNTQEGTISVSGTTVSYNGGHLSRWSQLNEKDKTDPTTIPKGTVMLGLDEMCEWEGEENEQLTRTKICDTPGSKAVAGVFIRYDAAGLIPDPDFEHPMIKQGDDEENEYLVPDPDVEVPLIPDPDHVEGDFYIAQTGDFVIRVTGPCENGDLLESNGDGTARVQKDDIQRSSTIAKVAFGFPDAAKDEENIVPCLLMLG